jgi:DNA polymerase-3 subunit gamma/tau
VKRVLLILDAFFVMLIVALGARIYTIWTEPTAPVSRLAPGPRGTGVPSAGAVPSLPRVPAPPPASGAAPAQDPVTPPRAEPVGPEPVRPEPARPEPMRSEAAPDAPVRTPGRPPEPPVAAAPTPRLSGVVIGPGEAPQALLEDPQTGEVARYRVGDTVAGARVVAIRPDRVIIHRGGAMIELRVEAPGATPPPRGGSPGPPAPGRPVPPGPPPTS